MASLAFADDNMAKYEIIALFFFDSTQTLSYAFHVSENSLPGIGQCPDTKPVHPASAVLWIMDWIRA